MANLGLECLADQIRSEINFKSSDSFRIIDEERKLLLSEIPYSHLLQGMKKDGPISQIIAHGMINWIYSAWNDRFRKRIADELGENISNIKCDVMGDIRIIRNIIAHDFGIAENNFEKLKIINWLPIGPIILRSEDMNRIQAEINSMNVYVQSNV